MLCQLLNIETNAELQHPGGDFGGRVSNRYHSGPESAGLMNPRVVFESSLQCTFEVRNIEILKHCLLPKSSDLKGKAKGV